MVSSHAARLFVPQTRTVYCPLVASVPADSAADWKPCSCGCNQLPEVCLHVVAEMSSPPQFVEIQRLKTEV